MTDSQDNTSGAGKRNKICRNIQRLAVTQVWIGVLALGLCIGVSESITDSYWLNWYQADFTACIFIIFTGSVGVASGIQQQNALLNGTYLTLCIISATVSAGIAVKCGFTLRDATSNWSFHHNYGMWFYLMLFLTMTFHTFTSLIICVYCLQSSRKPQTRNEPNHAPPQFPLFTTANGQMMVIQRTTQSTDEQQSCSSSSLSSRQSLPPPYTAERFTWM